MNSIRLTETILKFDTIKMEVGPLLCCEKKNVFRFTLSQQHIVQKMYKESATDLQIDGWTYLQLISQVEPSFLPKSCPSCKVNIELRTTKFKCYQNLEEYAIEILCGPGFHYKSTIEQIVFIERLNNKKNISKCFLYLPTHLIHGNGV